LTHLTPKHWAAIEALYVGGACGVPELARRHKVSASTVYRHAADGNWRVKRHAASKKVLDDDAAMSGEEASEGSFAARHHEPTMRERLIALLDRTLGEIEAAFCVSEPRTAADRERDARTLGAIMRILEKLNDQQKLANDAHQAAWMTRDDDAICKDLAKKIEEYECERKEGAL
jgi:hypothetical protein